MSANNLSKGSARVAQRDLLINRTSMIPRVGSLPVATRCAVQSPIGSLQPGRTSWSRRLVMNGTGMAYPRSILPKVGCRERRKEHRCVLRRRISSAAPLRSKPTSSSRGGPSSPPQPYPLHLNSPSILFTTIFSPTFIILMNGPSSGVTSWYCASCCLIRFQ